MWVFLRLQNIEFEVCPYLPVCKCNEQADLEEAAHLYTAPRHLIFIANENTRRTSTKRTT